mmetsp:Transcript_91471/g.191198  ORF Transcript_91471/g.191198 Transcript_91471/m.191198 type:complete len:118 (-) Transcript_91471:93-446(-)
MARNFEVVQRHHGPPALGEEALLFDDSLPEMSLVTSPYSKSWYKGTRSFAANEQLTGRAGNRRVDVLAVDLETEKRILHGRRRPRRGAPPADGAVLGRRLLQSSYFFSILLNLIIYS